MSESTDPIRIVYHAQNRTFARLFNEHSLEEVKNVVRRKLHLGRETDVSLKQMGPNAALLDLEDEDDFQAFRVLLRSSVSADIRVTVGGPQGSPAPPPVASQPPERPPVSELITTPSASPSRQPAGSATSGQPAAHPEIARTTEASTTTVKTPDPSARKRKVSFGDAVLATPDKPAERRTLKKPVTTVASAEVAASPATPKSVGAEEPPKKKQKKEATKAKDVQPTEAVESPSMKASGAPKPRPRKSAASDRAGEAGTSASKDAETSEPPVKKQKRQKKDDSTGLKKPSAPVDQGGIDQPVSQPNNPVNEASLQSASEKPKGTSAVGGISKTLKSGKTKPKGTACAAIPRTSASTNVQSEVAAAILSGYLSKTTETVPPEPPAKRKYVRKTTIKSSASSSALPVESTTVLDPPANEVPNVPTERRLEHATLTHEPPQQTLGLKGPPCPICLEEPFHIRYCCPTVMKGPDAIRERLEELKRANMGDQQSLIKELEGLLRDSKVTSKPSLDAAPTDRVQSRDISPPPSASLPGTPHIPSNSYVSEVTVESRDEGSSSESSDDMSEGGVEHKELPAPGQQMPDEQPSPVNDDLDAIMRGPASKRQSILGVLDRIVGDEDDEDSDSEEDEAELEEDSDEEIHRSRRQLSRHTKRSSDSESEDEESKSSSPSRSAKGISNNLEPGIQGSNNPAEESADSDIVMRDPVDSPVLEGQDDDSSQGTHVGSEDRVIVDHESIGEKGVTTIVEQQPSCPAPRVSVLTPSDVAGNEPQEFGQTEVDPASNRDGGVSVASEVPNEVEADPIEPADDLDHPTVSRSSDADPIEAPPEDIESLFTGVTQSTPKPGVAKRIKTRNGHIPDNEAEFPVLLEQLATEGTDEVTPLPTKTKSRKKSTETSASQEPAPTRRSPRFSSLPPSTSTPAAVVLLNYRSKAGARIGKAAKTPAKRSEERPDALQGSAKDGATRNGVRIAPTPSMIRWETLDEPLSSPSLQPEEVSVRIDELMSSSPHPDDNLVRGRLNDKAKKGRSRKPAPAGRAESSQGKERLFDLSSSQIAFPYSQHQNNPAPMAFPNGKEGEETTDSEEEEEPKVSKKKAALPAQYRSLSQLASQATMFSPSLPTPANKSVANGKAKNRVVDEDSSSSSSSDADEANGSEHIPRGRRAGSVLETKKKRSLLSRI